MSSSFIEGTTEEPRRKVCSSSSSLMMSNSGSNSSSVMMSHSASPNSSSLPSIFESCSSNPGGTLVWASCLFLCFAAGFPASVSVLWEMLGRRTRPLTPNDFFTLNLATMDAVFLAFIPVGLLNHFLLHVLVVESMWNWIYSLNMCGRPLLMACVCLDCYLAVVHPIAYRRRRSLTPRVAVAAIVWAVTMASGAAYFLDHTLFISTWPTAPYAVTIAIVGFCDYFILGALTKAERGSVHPQKQRALQTLVNSLVVTLISYLPPVLTYWVAHPLVPDPVAFMCTVAVPISVTASLGSAVMSLICLQNLGRLRTPVCGSRGGNA